MAYSEKAVDPAKPSLPSFGTVLDVGENTLCVWVSGVTGFDGVCIPVPLNAPGWLSEKGRDFTVSGDLRSLETATYSLHKLDAESEAGDQLEI
jgi:hypothetical protein